eukprot:GHVL01041145.1.p1 GENE.GHVL01041145.1~~GHVL01041145.1.p1  ORF type:complete len:533 (+),score=119.24 GHVL01041145.1:37-1599(+)
MNIVLMEELGKGAYGSVYKGIYRSVDKGIYKDIFVAVKIVDHKNSLKNEMDILKKFNSIYIVKYYDSYVKDDYLWIIMEYCPLGSIYDILKYNILNEYHISLVVYNILKALEYLHENKIIHRDIKSSNVVLMSDGRPKLADFGVAAELENSIHRKTTQIGTPYWMAPEVIKGDDVGYGPSADIWSLGITCIEMAEGRPPYSHMHQIRAMFHIVRSPVTTLKNTKNWSNYFNDFIYKCLTLNPENRPTPNMLLKHPFIKDIKNYDYKSLAMLSSETAENKQPIKTETVNLINKCNNDNIYDTVKINTSILKSYEDSQYGLIDNISQKTVNDSSSSPDQTVNDSSSSPQRTINIRDTYPHQTVKDSSPDQTVNNSSSSPQRTVNIRDTYPQQTVKDNSPDQTVSDSSSSPQRTVNIRDTYPLQTVKDSSPQRTANDSSAYPHKTVNIRNTYPDQTVNKRDIYPHQTVNDSNILSQRTVNDSEHVRHERIDKRKPGLAFVNYCAKMPHPRDTTQLPVTKIIHR